MPASNFRAPSKGTISVNKAQMKDSLSRMQQNWLGTSNQASRNAKISLGRARQMSHQAELDKAAKSFFKKGTQ